MKDKINLNAWGFASVVLLGTWIQYCISIIGKIPDQTIAPYDFWDAAIVFITLLIVWIVGYFSNFQRNK